MIKGPFLDKDKTSICWKVYDQNFPPEAQAVCVFYITKYELQELTTPTGFCKAFDNKKKEAETIVEEMKKRWLKYLDTIK